MPLISVVVPVLDDRAAVKRLLDALPPAADVEILLVDGGADPGLDPLALPRPDVRLLRSAPGRGCQMNAGAAAARGEWLLFLHADSRLPGAWHTAIATADDTADSAGGWFRLRIDATAWQARVIEQLAQLRVSVLGLAYGDQGFFVRRRIFTALGGFRELPLMEDVDFVCRLHRAGRIVPSSLEISTSARRWRRDGWFRRSTANVGLLALYFAGVSPARLARWYSAGSGRP